MSVVFKRTREDRPKIVFLVSGKEDGRIGLFELN